MGLKGHRKVITAVVAIAIVAIMMSATLVELARPVEVVDGTIRGGSYGIAITPPPSPVKFQGVIWIGYSYDANLLKGYVSSNITGYSVYILFPYQLAEWNTSYITPIFNGSPQSTPNGTIVVNEIMWVGANATIPDSLWINGGSGIVQVSFILPHNTQFAVVFIANTGPGVYNADLNFYHEVTRI